VGFSLRIGAWALLLSILGVLGSEYYDLTFFQKHYVVDMVIGGTLLICALIGFFSGLLSLLGILFSKQPGLWKPLVGFLLSLVNFVLGILMFIGPPSPG